MERFARVVLGYHGCRASVAAALLSGNLSIDEWAPSENAHDWLGHGLYFWEHAPERALEWARRKVERDGVGDERGPIRDRAWRFPGGWAGVSRGQDHEADAHSDRDP